MSKSQFLYARKATSPAMRLGMWAWGGALLGLLLALAIFAPARWLAALVGYASADRVQLADSRGTLWNGSAQLVLTGGVGSQDRATLADRLQWTLTPQLWAPGLAMQIQAPCCTPKPLLLNASLHGAGWLFSVGDGNSQWPAQLLTGLGTPWNTINAYGQLELRTEQLALRGLAGRSEISGQAWLLAREMSSRLSTISPIGSYRLHIQGGPVPTLALDTMDGSLQLMGSGQWVGGRLHFAGQASAAPDREAALANLLNIIGRRDGPRSIISLG